MGKFVLFLFLWFIGGVGSFMILDTESILSIVIYFAWFWLGFCGITFYNVKMGLYMNRKIK